MQLTRLRVVLLLILAISLTGSSVWYLTHALSATNRNSIINPGSLTVPCSFDNFVDGSNYDGRNCQSGSIDYQTSDACSLATTEDTALASTGGLIFFEPGQFNCNGPMLLTVSNVFVEGSGNSATNEASYPNAAFDGTILFATLSFPQGASLANPHYMIYVGGNGLQQLQGGGIERLSLANARGYAAGNIGGIAMGFALKFTIKQVTFGGFNQAGPTDYALNGPAVTFDVTLSNATAVGPTGGWYTIDNCYFEKNGGEEMLRFTTSATSDILIQNSVFFGPAFNKGIAYILNGSGIRFDNDLFYAIGTNNAPAIWVNGKLTGLSVTNSAFEQANVNAGAGNTNGFIQLVITGDVFLDNQIGVNFLGNSFFIGSAITIPMKYIYQVNQTTTNCPIHELGDVVDDLGTSVTYLSNNVAANFANVVFQIPSVAIGTTLPAIRGPLTAGASAFTYTDQDGYPEWANVVATNGMTGLTWRGVAVAITAGSNYLLNPGDAMVFTWATTAPTYKIVPAAIGI